MEQLLERFIKIRWELKVAALAAALAVVTGATYFFFISDLQGQIEAQKAQVRRLEDELIQKQSIANNLAEYRRQKELLEQRLDESRSELPNDASIDELLAQLSQAGAQAGIELTSVEPGTESRESGFYSKIPVKLAVTGNYGAIASFFDTIGRLKRIVNISEITLGGPAKDGDRVLLKGECLATTFRFIEQSDGKPGRRGGAR